MALSSKESFEYTNLDEQTRNIVWQYTSQIKDLMRLTAENIIRIGQKLTQVKSQLGHGSFQQWLRTEFEWSEQTARQFMQVYRWSETIENKNFVFSNLGTSALYLLAAPSTPPKAREEVLSLVEVGERVSYTRAKNIINQYQELSLAIDDNLAKTVDTEIEPETQAQLNDTSNLLFRLKTSELGFIVKLYHTEELEAITNLTVGAMVKIKIGRLQGETATIVEVLNEQQLTTNDRQQPSPNLADLPLAKMDFNVSVLDEVNFKDREKLRQMSQHLIISYESVCLAIAGNSQTLTAFTKQIKIDPQFTKDIFQQALDRQNAQR